MDVSQGALRRHAPQGQIRRLYQVMAGKMKPLLDEAFRLLQRYATTKGKVEHPCCDPRVFMDSQKNLVSLEIEAFNQVVQELSATSSSLSAVEIEHKLMLISVYAFKISEKFKNFITEFDALRQEGG